MAEVAMRELTRN